MDFIALTKNLRLGVWCLKVLALELMKMKKGWNSSTYICPNWRFNEW